MALSKIALEKAGIIHDPKGKMKTRYWCNTTQTHIIILPSDTWEDVLKNIFDEAFSQGVDEGKTQRSKEIRELLQ